MKIKILFTVFFFSVLAAQSQDIITKINGDEVKAKILEISSTEVRYKRFDYPEGPTYVLNRSEVFIINYADGHKDIITPMDSNIPSEQNGKTLLTGPKTCISIGYGAGVARNSRWLFGYINDYYFYNDEDGAGKLLGPFYAKIETRVSEQWWLGINLAYVDYRFDRTYNSYQYDPQLIYPVNATFTEHITYTSFSGLFRANWHFLNVQKIDPYFGFGLGFRTAKYKYSNTDPYPDLYYYNNNDYFPLGFETTVGARYSFHKQFGIYAEAGFAKSAVQFGLFHQF